MMKSERKNENAAGSQGGTGGEFRPLVEQGILTAGDLEEALRRAQARGLEIEKVLSIDYKVGKRDLLAALAKHYNCPAVEYDERLPVPPELLAGLAPDSLSTYQWFPVMKDRSGTVVIAARNPESAAMREDVRKLSLIHI